MKRQSYGQGGRDEHSIPMGSGISEAQIESAALAWLEASGWRIKHGQEIAPDGLFAERQDFGQVVLEQRLRDALARLNPALPAEALEDAFRKLTRPEGADLLQRNRALHRLLIEGIPVEYLQPSPRPDGHPSPTGRGDGGEGAQLRRGDEGEGLRRWGIARVIDFEDPGANDWLAVNQFAVIENRHSRRPDIVLFVNGLPLAVLELKNAADADATIWTAWQQLQTYQAEIPSLFAPNAVLVVSDGLEARLGPLDAGREWFKPWRTITGADFYPPPVTLTPS